MNIRARQDQLLVQELDKELVVYDQNTDRVHRLNQAAASVWRSCDGRSSVAEMATALAAQTDLPADEEIVHFALTQLDKAGLLLESGPGDISRKALSRRRLLTKLGVGAGIALLLPAVQSLVAPAPVFAKSRIVR